jgi:arabinan endo-1,5-alpha-L-arabinosidase
MMRNACWIVLVTVLAVGGSRAAGAATVSLSAAPGTGQVTLSWTVASGAIDSQEVYQDTDADPAGRVRIASLAASARSFTVTGLAGGTTYFFWIKARQTSDGTSINSNAASAAPSAGGAAAVTSLYAVAGSGQAALTWTASGTITAQEIYRDTDANPSGRVRIATPSTSTRTFTDTGRTNNTTVWYWVRVQQSNGTWVESSAASARPNTSSFWSLSGNLGTHDPTLIEENGVWYEFQTGAGIFGKVSHDGGFTWDPLAAVLPNGLSWWKTVVPDQSGIDVWAPAVKKFNGRVWMYYAISTFGSKVSAIGLISAPSIAAGGWRDDGMILRTTDANDYNAIDPDLVIDAAGVPWLVFGSWNSGIKLSQLDASMKITGSLKSLAAKDGGIEGPAIVLHDGRYYLFVSTGLCCQGVNSTYQIRVGRSSSITGPYLDQSGVDMMSGGGTLLDGGNARWIGPGGQDIYGTGVLVRHAYDANDSGNPKLLINTLSWDANGWPRY